MTEGNKQISVGDLVVAVRDCCGKTFHLGVPYVVAEIRKNGTRCQHCGHSNEGLHAGVIVNFEAGIPLPWLKRIPPLSELESSKTDEPMKEPA